MHEGRSINKLQNGIILLIFKIRKIRNVGFVHNSILSNSCEFYYNDVTVVSFVNDIFKINRLVSGDSNVTCFYFFIHLFTFQFPFLV